MEGKEGRKERGTGGRERKGGGPRPTISFRRSGKMGGRRMEGRDRRQRKKGRGKGKRREEGRNEEELNGKVPCGRQFVETRLR